MIVLPDPFHPRSRTLCLGSILWSLALYPLDRYATRARLVGLDAPTSAAAAAAVARVAAPAEPWAAFSNYAMQVVTEVRPRYEGGKGGKGRSGEH